MNGIARNVAVVLFGALTSVLTAAALLFLEARSGQTLFGYALWAYVPVGSIGAGLVGALGYLAGALVLRARPAQALLAPMVLIAAGIVLVAQSASLGLMMEGRKAPKDVASFSRFLGTSVMQTQLPFTGGFSFGDSSSSSSGSSSSGGGARPAVPAAGDSKVDGISGGVSNMMATQDVSNMGPMRQVGQIGDGIDSLGSGVKSHGLQWLVTSLQIAGFALGGLLAFSYLRSRAYCKNCMLLLSRKGEQTRYFDRSEDARSSADEVLTKAKSRRLQQSIEVHVEKGTEAKSKWSEFCSTIEIMRCRGCDTHRMNFRSMRKAGASWKDIAAMGYSGSSMEPLDVV